mmetsp:Transcript_60056/g.128917  ORF Transcript_60056/g.128917 Transcript_60056/m.128917 type:complete len:303 (+) Transcript_60056:211-1119(+)
MSLMPAAPTGNSPRACQARVAAAQTCWQLDSASSRDTVRAALAFCRMASTSATSSLGRLAPTSLTTAWATKSRSEGERPPPSIESSAGDAPRSSSSFRKESGKTTPRALDRGVPRFMKFPMARAVLMHFRINSEERKVRQHEHTFSVAARISTSSRAGPTIKAPHANFAAHAGTVPKTQRYRSGKSNWARSASATSSWRNCSTASRCSEAALWRANTASAGRLSGKSSKVLTTVANCSGGGNLLNAIANNWEVRSSRTRSRFRGSSRGVAVPPPPAAPPVTPFRADGKVRDSERANWHSSCA